MSLVYCPECGHEVSANAVACANCGFPMQAAAPAAVEPIVEQDVVVTPGRPVRREGFPPWAIAPIVLGGLALVFLMFLLFRSPNDEANVNVAVNANARRQAELTRDTRNETVPATGSQTVTVPPSGSAPVSIPPPPPSSQSSIPETATSQPVAPPATKGSVVISARIVAPRSNSPAAARNAKFYLLDKDVESILSEARVEPIEGNTLSGSMGLAAVFPDRYGDFQRAAMRAIGRHVKYSGTTDGSGKANLSNVEPKEYYLFGVTRVAGGFALWSSPISVIAGQNMLDLSPQSVTEVSGDNSGDE